MIYKSLKRLRWQLIQFKRSLQPYLHWKRKLGKDPLFNLSTVDRGLLPRLTSASRTAEQRLALAQRVLDADRRASVDQEGQRAVYKVSNEWIPLFRKPLRPLLAALETGDAIQLRDLLDNFFRNSVSQGLCGLAADMAGTFFTNPPSRYLRTQLLIDSVYRYRLLERLLLGTKPADLHIEDFGNPYGMFVEGEFLRTGVDYQYYYSKRVSQMLAGRSGRLTVAELGGGIGGFAYFLNKALSPGLTYINPPFDATSTAAHMEHWPVLRTLERWSST